MAKFHSASPREITSPFSHVIIPKLHSKACNYCTNYYIQGLVARQPYLCRYIPYLVCYYIWLLGTFVNGSCDTKINIKIVKIAV